jgi:tRNA-specific 2-thiouridylase
VAEREESMGICFVGEVPIRQFLLKKIKPRPGKIVLANKTVVGAHTGLPFYTIGQRVGVGGGTAPFYVVAKDKKKNQLIVAHENSPFLYKKECTVKNINWISGTPKLPLSCLVRLRHRQPLQKAVVCHSERSEAKSRNPLTIRFAKSQRAITPGQFAVFYRKGECLGGGEIL